MKQLIQAQIQNFSQEEIKDMIPQDTLARIKSNDPSPVFKAYCVGHEGECEANMVGKGHTVFKYFQDAIIKLSDKLRFGTTIFHGHNKDDNSHDGRVSIGELVGKTLKNIGGKLSSIVALYIKPEYRSLPLDVASIESDIEFTKEGNEVKVEEVTNVSGIALGNSAVNRPGFPGATLLGAMQAFGGKGGEMTKEEIIAAVKAGNIKPSDIYTKEDLVSDKVVSEHVKAEKTYEYEYGKRIKEQLEDLRKTRETEIKEKDGKIAELSSQIIVGKAEGVFKTLATERKVDEKALSFMNRNFKGFKSEAKDESALKTDVNKFIDAQLAEYAETAKLFGVTPAAGNNNPSAASGTGTPPGDRQGDSDNLEDPKNNDFIPA
ncbi:MAG: hypothetical protein WC261_04435 [Synergistaceae bacterium]|jgi:hypothetical protein